jgi:hypothetical protein
MTPTTGRSGRLIRETLDSLVSPSIRDSILVRALTESELEEVPTDSEELRRFVHGPLRDALVVGLGDEMAESVLEEVSRVARLSETPSEPGRRAARPGPKRSLSPPPRRNTPSHRMHAVRSTPPTPKMPSLPPSAPDQTKIPTLVPAPFSSRPPVGRVALTPPPHSGPVSRPGVPWGSDEYPTGAASLGLGDLPEVPEGKRAYVLVLTEDTLLLQRLLPWLDDGAELVQVTSLRELVRDLEALADARIALVLDCRRPAVRPAAVAAIADELPPSVGVVVWGPTAEQERAMLAVSPSVSCFVVVRADARPKEIAARCKSLVG